MVMIVVRSGIVDSSSHGVNPCFLLDDRSGLGKNGVGCCSYLTTRKTDSNDAELIGRLEKLGLDVSGHFV